MSTINLVILVNNPSSTSNTIRYARIDNTSTPVYTTIPNVPNSTIPYIISNVPNGQYFIGTTPIYSDGRTCPEVSETTAPCTGINSFAASINGDGNIVVTYNADPSVPSVKVNIIYPNGGGGSQIYNNGDVITIVPPVNTYGNYTVTMQPVCDSDTGFFGISTAPAIVSINQPSGGVTAIVTSSFGSGAATVTAITGIPGFSLPTSPLTFANSPQTGVHTSLSFGTLSFAVTGTTGGDVVTLTINGTDVISQQPVNGASSPYSFSGISFANSDSIVITFFSNL